MQVTDEMVEAAFNSWFHHTTQARGNHLDAMREAVQAALDVMPKATGGFIPGPTPRGDSILAKLGDGSCTFTLPKTPTRGPLPPGTTITFSPIGDIGDMVEALTCLTGKRTSASIPVTEPRPLATVGELHHYLGQSREFVLHAAAGMPEYDPPFPDPVREYGEDREPLYDPEAVKAWYDALPQAADG